MNSTLSLVLAVFSQPGVIDAFTRLLSIASKVREAEPVGFLRGLFDPSKAEENAAAIVSAGLDAQLAQLSVEVIQLAITTAEADRVGRTIGSST